MASGILTEAGVNRATHTGTPQGGILSPLLANIALSGLDEHFARTWEVLGPPWTRAKLRRNGVPAYRLARYADDFVVMVGGPRADAGALWVGSVLAPMGLRLSMDKSGICHIDQGSTFWGSASQRAAGPRRDARVPLFAHFETLAGALLFVVQTRSGAGSTHGVRVGEAGECRTLVHRLPDRPTYSATAS